MSYTDFFSPTFYYTFADHEPALTVKPGTALRVTCPDSDNVLADGTELEASQRQVCEGGELFPGNPMAGPIAVAGATIGDTITVAIDDIELDRDYGQTLLAPGHGLLRRRELGDTPPRHMYRWRIDTASGTATLDNPLGDAPITVPLEPFIGCIGTCPKWGQGISSLYSGEHGGNMDLPLIRPGVTVYLPVFRAGGGVMMGDIHAAQGHGEIVGGGIETSGKIRSTLSLLRGQSLSAPRLVSSDAISALGFGGNLRTAMARAYAHLIEWLADPAHMALNRWDAYQLVSQCATIVVGNLGDPPNCAAATIRRERLTALDTDV